MGPKWPKKLVGSTTALVTGAVTVLTLSACSSEDTGGGGTGLCSHFRGICTAGDGRPEDRGALFHAVEVTVAEDGAISGRVHQAFGGPRITF